MNKKALSAVLTATMILSPVIAVNASAEEKSVTLTMIDHTSEDAKVQWENNAVERFMADHPNVTIEVQRMSMDDYTQTIATKFASDDAPDIFCEDSSTLPSYIDNGYVADLTDTEAVSRLGEGATDSLSRDGVVYAVPMNVNAYVVTYNKKAFEAAGITEVPTTASELIEDCDKLTEAGITPYALGYGESWVIMGDIQTDYVNNLLTKEEGAIEKLQNRETTFSESEYWRGALERIAQRMSYANSDPFGTDWASACQMLVNGECAMILNGDWTSNNCAAYGDVSDFGAFVLPITDSPEDLTLMTGPGGQGFCVNANSENLDLAKEFLSYLVDEESVAYYLENCHEICLVADADTSNATGSLADIQGYFGDEKIASPYSGMVNFNTEYFDALGTCIADFLLGGGTDVDSALAALDAEFDRIANS